MNISYLPDAETHPLWPQIRALLEPAANFGGIAVKDEAELVWIAFEGATVFGAATTVMWKDGTAELRCVAGSRFKDWGRDMESVLDAWARDCGAARLTARGRKGWARLCRAFGWDCLGTDADGEMTIFKKDLTDGA